MTRWNFDPSYGDEIVNMYGFTPCPKCRSRYRYAINRDPNTALCDDCGHAEPVVEKPEDM